MNEIHFTKMHGLGNDFVVIDCRESVPFLLETSFIARLANRHLGIGFDQLILIENSKKADFSCRFFNADGSEAEQCGNGVRAAARFLHEGKWVTHSFFQIETKAGIVDVEIKKAYQEIQVNMGVPTLISNDGEITIVSMGNPHAILQVQSIEMIDMDKHSREVASHAHFPHGINVGLMKIINRNHIQLRTFERGVGETLACGTNACAAVVAGITHHVLDARVEVELTLGSLWIEWQGGIAPLIMSGPADNVFSGMFSILK